MTQRLASNQFVVLAQADRGAEAITPKEVLAPRMYTGGIGSYVHDFHGASSSTIVWFLEWPNGLSVAVGSGLAEPPDPESVYLAAVGDRPVRDLLLNARAANELPC